MSNESFDYDSDWKPLSKSEVVWEDRDKLFQVEISWIVLWCLEVDWKRIPSNGKIKIKGDTEMTGSGNWKVGQEVELPQHVIDGCWEMFKGRVKLVMEVTVNRTGKVITIK